MASDLTGARLVEVGAITACEAPASMFCDPKPCITCRIVARAALRAQAEAAGVTAEGLLWVANIPTAHAVPEVPALLRALAEVLRDE